MNRGTFFFSGPVFIVVGLFSSFCMAGDSGSRGNIGGTASGLTAGSSITLSNNGGDPLTVSSNGRFLFPSPIPKGATYNVTIASQPENLRCIVQNGTGTVSGRAPANIIVTCPMAYQDSLVWMRCTHGQKWNVAKGDCTGNGKADSFGALQLRYCSTNNTACNGGSNTGTLDSGEVFQACNDLNAGEGTYGITGWRVPTKEESAGLVVCSDGTRTPLRDYNADPYKCGYNGKSYTTKGWIVPALNTALFPNSRPFEYWTATPSSNQASSAWYTAFQNGWTQTASKSGRSFVRCVSGP